MHSFMRTLLRSWPSALLLTPSVLAATPHFNGWGPALGLGPTASEIVYSKFTTYPGRYPKDQAGGLFLWVGMGGTDLIQAIVGAYTPGNSECGTGVDADTHWYVHDVGSSRSVDMLI